MSDSLLVRALEEYIRGWEDYRQYSLHSEGWKKNQLLESHMEWIEIHIHKQFQYIEPKGDDIWQIEGLKKGEQSGESSRLGSC